MAGGARLLRRHSLHFLVQPCRRRAVGGRFVDNVKWADVREEIDNDRVFVVGNEIHYYVVFGYSEEDGAKWLFVLDPWPAGKGGLKSVLSFGDLEATEGHVFIAFGS